MKSRAVAPLRSPTRHDGMSLVSAQMAVQVHTSPASGGGLLARSTFFCLAYTNDHASSTSSRLHGRSRRCSSWYSPK